MANRSLERLLTLCFRGLVVRLADQLAVLHKVELVAGVELTRAHRTHKALQVVHVVLGPPDHLGWRNAEITGRTLGSVPPVGPATFTKE